MAHASPSASARRVRTRVGIEVGGTFTDLVAVGPDGVRVAKVLSTPASPERGAFDALAAAGIALGAVDEVVHGSTVATNAILERRGARVAFVTTAGFRDLLFLQRHDRRRIYDLAYQRPAPLVRRRACFEVVERVLVDGSIETPLDLARARAELVPALAEGDFEAVAICLLHAYANPAHEVALADLLRRACPDVRVIRSTEVTGEFREYERASTTVLSAYVQPVIDRYLRRFEERLAEDGFAGDFTVMQSSGGRLPARATRENPITAIFSGPAAGVVGAARQAARSGFRDVITFDMGGTSTDVSLVERGAPGMTAECEIDGLPVRVPVLDIVSVGAGGGSIVWVDDGGLLRVGPRSAGADPGPACYGRGGTLPTVTDAHVVRGTIEASTRLGGTLPLDAAAARAAFAPLAQRLGDTPEAVADGAVRLATAHILRAVREVSTQRGRDPRDYALVGYGGAGPMHAAEVAAELGIRTVVVPPNAGAISAFGLLAADYTRALSITRRFPLDAAAPAALAALFAEARDRLAGALAGVGLGDGLAFSLVAEMRFVGQAFEIPIAIDPASLPTLTAAGLEQAFLRAYREVYLHATSGPAEIVTARVVATRPLEEIPAMREADAAGESHAERTVRVTGIAAPVAALAASALRVDAPCRGPALLTGRTVTIFVPPAWSATLDAHANIVMRSGAG